MSTSTVDSTKKFSKILVAIDGSEASMDAADYAILMARVYNSSMTALHVIQEKIRYEYQDKIDSDVPSDASTNTDSLRRIVEMPRQEIEENSFRNHFDTSTLWDNGFVNLISGLIYILRREYSSLLICMLKCYPNTHFVSILTLCSSENIF